MTSFTEPAYLEPYLAASRKYGAGFGTLLWASPKTQAVRFKALLQAVDISGRVVLDAGCGRADLLEFMIRSQQYPMSYIGLEAVETLAFAAERKRLPNCRIVRGDFVENPSVMNLGADVVLFSGSLNTMETSTFYRSLEIGFSTAGHAMVFNFLSSPFLAGGSHLNWHHPADVMTFAKILSTRVELFENYLRGDSTVAIWKDQP